MSGCDAMQGCDLPHPWIQAYPIHVVHASLLDGDADQARTLHRVIPDIIIIDCTHCFQRNSHISLFRDASKPLLLLLLSRGQNQANLRKRLQLWHQVGHNLGLGTMVCRGMVARIRHTQVRRLLGSSASLQVDRDPLLGEQQAPQSSPPLPLPLPLPRSSPQFHSPSFFPFHGLSFLPSLCLSSQEQLEICALSGIRHVGFYKAALRKELGRFGLTSLSFQSLLLVKDVHVGPILLHVCQLCLQLDCPWWEQRLLTGVCRCAFR